MAEFLTIHATHKWRPLGRSIWKRGLVGLLYSARDSLKNDELRHWMKCRGDSCKGLTIKAQLVAR